MLTRSPEKALPAVNGDLPFVGLDSIQPDTLKVTETVPFNTLKSAGSRFRAGDVLYGRLRPYLNKVWHADHEGACSGELLVLRPHAELDPAYLAYLLHSRGFVDYASHAVTGDRPRLDYKQLADFPIKLPDLNVQRRIVARIDALFSELDDSEEALRRARGELETYRKALLKAAVTGALTADWRAANPPRGTGADLLARILADRRARWEAEPRNRGKRYEGPVLPAIGKRPLLPISWAWATLETLSVEEPRNGLSIKETKESTGVRSLRLGALTDDGVNWEDYRYLPRQPGEVVKYRLLTGDLLVSRANGSPAFVGRCSICSEPPNDMIFPDTAIRYRLGGEQHVWRWVASCWGSPVLRQQLLSLAKTTAGILKVSQQDIRSVLVPVPPESEVREIVSRIDASLGAQADLVSEINDQSARNATLRQSILAAAFRGELSQ